MKELLEQLADGHSLSTDQAEHVLAGLLSGEFTEAESAAFLMGMRAKGETPEEIAAFARVLRRQAVPVPVDATGAVDMCGTGGDRSGTFNISTAAMFITAGAGVPVLKHGNRSVSSRSGSADVLEELGVNVMLEPDQAGKVFEQVGAVFLFAPLHHPVMKNVGSLRRALGIRTFFNLLGPLLNPAGVTRQVVGAYSLDAAALLQQVAPRLGYDRFTSIHAEDGLDEVSLSSPTWLHEYRDGIAPSEPIRFDPDVLGLDPHPQEAIAGGDAARNAQILRDILLGSAEPAQQDIALLNAAFAIQTSRDHASLGECLDAARESLHSGAAASKWRDLAEASRSVS